MARYADACLVHEAVAFGGPAAPGRAARRGDWIDGALADAFDATDVAYARSSVEAIAERAVAAFLQPDPVPPRSGRWARALGGRRFLPGSAARSGAPGVAAQAWLRGAGAAVACMLLLFGFLARAAGDDEGASDLEGARSTPREEASRRRVRRSHPSPASSATSGAGSSLPLSPLRAASLRARLVRSLDAASFARPGVGSPATPPCSPACASGAALSSAGSSAFPGVARGARAAKGRDGQVDDSIIFVSSDSDEEEEEMRDGNSETRCDEAGEQGERLRPTRSFPSARPRTALLAALLRPARLGASDDFASPFPFPASFSPLAARPACSAPLLARGAGDERASEGEDDDDVIVVSVRSGPAAESAEEVAESSGRGRAPGERKEAGAEGERGTGVKGEARGTEEAGHGVATCARVKREAPDLSPILKASQTHEE